MATLKESIDFIINRALDTFSGDSYQIEKITSGNVMGVFGSSGGTGVSSFVYEMARLFASENQRVLVIDGDLLRPIQHVHCEKKLNYTITDYFTDKCELSDIIKKDENKIDYLETVPISIMKMNELDNTPKLYNRTYDKLNNLRSLYDIIIVDLNLNLATTPIELALLAFCNFFVQLSDESIASRTNEATSAALVTTINTGSTIIPVLNKAHTLIESKLSGKIKLPYDYNFVQATANEYSYIFQGQSDNNNLYEAYITLFKDIKEKMTTKEKEEE